jgi:hypothetical protein
MKSEDLVKRVDELIEMGSKALSTRNYKYDIESLDSGAIKGFRAASLSFIDRVYGSNHPHFKEFQENTKDYYPSDAENGIAILRAIRSEIDGGWLFTLKGLITAEVFADFIEMAEHLLETGYKDPAAVMCGSVLEEHLRQLCTRNAIAIEIEKDDKQIHKKADRLNSELAKNEVYSKLDQKMVTAWLDLRNKAAHGKYDEYTEDQVKNMLVAVTEFMARVAV